MGASVSVAQGAPLDAGTYKADEAAVERFCELLRIPTVSRENIAERDDEPFSQWIPTLQRLYPHLKSPSSHASTTLACSCVGLAPIPPWTPSS